jgi:hypothetical protein
MMIKAGDSLMINPVYVAAMTWDRRYSMSGPNESTLIVRTCDGHEYRIKHDGSTDAYAVERAIVAAINRPALSDATRRT